MSEVREEMLDWFSTVTQITSRYSQGMLKTAFECTISRTLKQTGHISCELRTGNWGNTVHTGSYIDRGLEEHWLLWWVTISAATFVDGRVRVWCKHHGSDPGRGGDSHPTNLQQLRDALTSIRTKTCEECLRHLVGSMPQRISSEAIRISSSVQARRT